MKKVYLALCLLFFAHSLIANDITIEDIERNPLDFKMEMVTITGIVTQFIPGDETTTSHYLLRGDYGGEILVNTPSEAPETYKKYEVSGILYYDANERMAFISERNRVQKDIVPPPAEAPEKEKSQSDILLYVIIGAGLLIVVLILLLVFKKSKGSSSAREEKPMEEAEYQHDEDYKTIKLNTGNPESKTLKFIPGEFKIISGTDKGKTFKIAGYPTPEGNIVTIGREQATGPRNYAHVQLKEKTVSGKQAEIIQVDGKLMVKNISSTNNTVVDGVELEPEETVELQPNSTIKTGEVEFQYLS